MNAQRIGSAQTFQEDRKKNMVRRICHLAKMNETLDLKLRFILKNMKLLG